MALSATAEDGAEATSSRRGMKECAVAPAVPEEATARRSAWEARESIAM
jgi:hypothetical protein